MMSFVFPILLTTLLQQPPTAPPEAAKSATEIQKVSADVKLIEEKSLLLWSGLANRTRREPGMTTDPGGGVSMHAADPNNPAVPDTVEDAPSGIRLYAFLLVPQENLKLRLKCESHGKVVMKMAPRPQQDAMAAQFRKANMPPRASRASRIEITNVTDQPYEVVLSLSGQMNYAYKLEIERKVK